MRGVEASTWGMVVCCVRGLKAKLTKTVFS